MSSTATAPAATPTLGISLKIASTFVFTAMVACVKQVSVHIPPGEIVFFRSFFALLPILLYLSWRGEIAGALGTRNLIGHFWRGLAGVTAMFLWFVAVGLLPLPEAMALGFASPLITVALAALVLGETVRIYRWSAVITGFAGILVILWPRLDGNSLSLDSGHLNHTLGALAALGSALTVAVAMTQLRRLVTTETTASIVVNFSVMASFLALFTIPFGWTWPEPGEAVLLVLAGILGGVGQVLMTESYRRADASTIANFDYTSMIWGLLLGWLVFGEAPDAYVIIGASIVIAAGLFIIYRERKLYKVPPAQVTAGAAAPTPR